jgi:hypothetical protein
MRIEGLDQPLAIAGKIRWKRSSHLLAITGATNRSMELPNCPSAKGKA